MANNNNGQYVRSAVSRRRFVGAVGTGATLSLAGCTGNGDPIDGEELTFWHQEGVPHRADMFEEFAARFSEEHDDIEVTVEVQNWDELFGALTSALEAGQEPDFMFALPTTTMTFQARGHLVDVSELVERIDDQHTFIEPTVDPFQYDGGTWGIPMWDMVYLNHYRSDIYADVDTWPPSNWDEWLEGVSQVTDEGSDEYGITLPANRNLWTTQNLYTLMIQNDAYVYGPDGGIMFDTEETVETLEFYKNMFEAASPPDATGWDWADWERALFQENAFSTNGFSSWIRGLQDTDHYDQWEAMEQPYPEGGSPGSVHYVNNIMVFNENELDAIGEFVEWLHQPDNYGEWLSNTEPTLYLPVTEAGQDSDAFWEQELVSQYEDMVSQQYEALDNASIYGFREPHVENDLYLPSIGELEGSHLLAEVVEQLIVMDLTPEEAASWGQDRLEDGLDVETSDEL